MDPFGYVRHTSPQVHTSYMELASRFQANEKNNVNGWDSAQWFQDRIDILHDRSAALSWLTLHDHRNSNVEGLRRNPLFMCLCLAIHRARELYQDLQPRAEVEQLMDRLYELLASVVRSKKRRNITEETVHVIYFAAIAICLTTGCDLNAMAKADPEYARIGCMLNPAVDVTSDIEEFNAALLANIHREIGELGP